jgi:aromatic ring hydroxylase
MSHDRLKEAAFKAVDALVSDTSVSIHQTRDDLVELRDHIEMWMDATASSMPKDNEWEDL